MCTNTSYEMMSEWPINIRKRGSTARGKYRWNPQGDTTTCPTEPFKLHRPVTLSGWRMRSSWNSRDPVVRISTSPIWKLMRSHLPKQYPPSWQFRRHIYNPQICTRAHRKAIRHCSWEPKTGNNSNVLHDTMNKLLYVSKMEYYAAMKTNELQLHPTTRVNFMTQCWLTKGICN